MHYFTDDLYLDTNEMKTILKEIIKTLSKIQDYLVIVSLGFSTQYDYLFSKLFSRTIKIEQGYNILSVHVDDNNKKSLLQTKQEELETIPQH